MSDKDAHNFDQNAAFLGDSFPPLWKRLFDGCVSVGFTELQSMELLKTYIFGSSGGRLEK